MIWSREETLPRKELRELQLERLKAVVERVYERVPFYKKKFDQAGVKPGDIKDLRDIRNLPFTTKDDLRDNYPFGMFAVPMTEVVRVHASSGTTGKPTVVGYTRKDVETWADLMARALVGAGVHEGDIIHNAYGYGLFTGGLGFHYGAEKLGATVIPISGGNTQRQLMIMQDFGSTVLCCTPSYALNLADVIEQQGLSGLHVYEDHFLVEVIDPETGEALPPGEEGELVFTTLTKEVFPLIRYRTRDISRLIPDPCVCGRTFYRMARVTGRTDDMLIIRGVNVFPSQIEHVLLNIEGLEPHYQIIVDRRGALDELEVQVEVSEKVFSDEMKRLDELKRRIEHDLKDFLGVGAKVTLVEPRTIQRFEGKAKRVIDKRKF